MTIYDRIDMELKRRHWSRRKLADFAGININTMCSLFARKPDPLPDKYLNKIADALDIPVHELKGISIVGFPAHSRRKKSDPFLYNLEFALAYENLTYRTAENELVAFYNLLNKPGKSVLLRMAETLSQMAEFRDSD